jgi:putative ABC transport system permease protein
VKRSLRLAWLQLGKEKLRLLVALAGVAFAVVLVSMQLGFRDAMYESAVRYHQRLRYDLVMISPKTPFIGIPKSFSRRRLYQALAAEGVASVTPVYIRQGFWRNPWRFGARNILVVGIDPARDVVEIEGVRGNLDALKMPDVVLFDAASRPEYGPVAEALRDQDSVSAEVNDRRIEVVGLFRLGTSFGIDGSLITSDLNFLRMFPERAPGLIDLGLIHLERGVDPGSVQRNLEAALERDVQVLARSTFVAREVRYWGNTTPIGFVFGFGAVMGLAVGGVIVYQILFADVSEHLAEYATLKAIGYTNSDLSGLVLREAALLAVLGFVPGLGIAAGLYEFAAEAARLPLELTPSRVALTLLLTSGMCALSGLMALRKVRSCDPAEVFG